MLRVELRQTLLSLADRWCWGGGGGQQRQGDKGQQLHIITIAGGETLDWADAAGEDPHHAQTSP